MKEMATWSLRKGKQGIYREWVGVRLPFEVRRELEKRAKARGISISDLIRLYIEQGLKKETEEVEP
jgi:post-segregation antitoxin (ccd killing protein)